MSGKSRVHPLLLAAFTITLGLILRLAPLHLPTPVTKYAGSALYAVMIYLLCTAAAPSASPRTLALISFAITTAIEFFKLVHTPTLDAFRLTLPGKLLLGRFFAVADLLAYALAIAATAALYQHLATRPLPPSPSPKRSTPPPPSH